MKTARWVLLFFGLLAAGAVLAGAGCMAWLYHALNEVQFH